jgi:malonyl CoA-acyl carrier protein transacylase/phosphopantetheinyl transferase
MRAEARPYHRQWPAEVLTFASESREGLIRDLKRFESYLSAHAKVTLRDLAYALNIGPPTSSAYRLAFVASTLAEAAERAAVALTRVSKQDCQRINDPRGIYFFAEPLTKTGGLAFLFPGEASQYSGMLSELCLWFPCVRSWFDRMDRAFLDHPRGWVPSQSIFPLSRQQEIGADRLWQADGAVEAVFAASQGILALLQRMEIRPDALAGHSAGDYSALFASGAIRNESESEFIQQARAINSVYEEFSACGAIPKGILLAVNSADRVLVDNVLAQGKDDLYLALDNCPHQVVLCGTEEATNRTSAALRAAGAICDILPFDRAYHTPKFQLFSKTLFDLSQKFEITAPRIPVYSCVTAAPYPDDPAEIRMLMAAQWSQPVRFRESVEAMYRSGIRIFVEVGPRGNLTSFVEDILRGRSCVAIASNIAGRAAMVQLQHLVAVLFASGVPMRLNALYSDSGRVLSARDVAGETKSEPQPRGIKLALRLPGLCLPEGINYASPHPPTPPDISSRTGVVERFFQNTQRALDIEREVMKAFLAARSQPVGSLQGRGFSDVLVNLPFVTKALSVKPGQQVNALCQIDLREDLFLKHHTLAGRISTTEPDLVALPVVPMTITMEILAEAASILVPGKIVVGMRDVQAFRWIAIEDESLSLEVQATIVSASEVQVELQEARSGGAKFATGTVIFAECYSRDFKPVPAHLDYRPSRWPSGRMYEGTGMFHGPLFQAVTSVARTSLQGSQAGLIGLSARGFFNTKAPNFLIDPVTLDAMGQVVGFWVGDHFRTGLNVFPFRLAKLDLYRQGLLPGEQARCDLRVLSFDDAWIRSDIEVVGENGNPVMRMTGWEDRRLDLPRRFYDFRISPAEVLLSDPWAAPIRSLPESNRFRCVALESPPQSLFESHGYIWLTLLAYMVLNRAERRVWQGMEGKRRIEWLLGRIAGKDAVRLFLKDTAGLSLCPADIEITSNGAGAPEVTSEWANELEAIPFVSISHTGDMALAVAGRSAGCASIGGDVEQIGRITAEVQSLIFSTAEQRLLATFNETARSEWATRIWCAKEAVGKALGCGVLVDPTGLQVQDVDVGTGEVRVSVSKHVLPLAASTPQSLTAYTGVEGGQAFGTALLGEQNGYAKSNDAG